MKGIVKIYKYNKDNKLIHYEEGNNTSTIYAGGMMSHLYTGETYSTFGSKNKYHSPSQRNPDGHGSTSNPDGTIVSGEGYFSVTAYGDTKLKYWNSNAITLISSEDYNNSEINGTNYGFQFPFFPTKILLGTGLELSTYADATSDEITWMAANGVTAINFGTNVNDLRNAYSNTYTTSLQKAKTVDSSEAITLTASSTNWGITGGIKNGLVTETSDTDHFNNGSITDGLLPEYLGVGNPCFIYFDKSTRNYIAGSDIIISGSNIITYKITLPSQSSAGVYYPYNGWNLREAGLFCDARWSVSNAIPSDADNLVIYNKMLHGVMVAKRILDTPVTKTYDETVVLEWSIQIS